jgi:serine/threonine-protein kinase HipA
MSTRARVVLWGRRIGAVLWDPERSVGAFEYEPDFVGSGIQVAPLTVPLRRGVFDFPELPRGTFHGLPGFLADSLPDRFGNALIDRWLAEQGRPAGSMDPVERLLYTGRRGMGALEFEPAQGVEQAEGVAVEIAPLAELAHRILAHRESLAGVLDGKDDREALIEILRVGTSAGGARAKAVLAWNEATGEFHSGQTHAGPGFTQWLLEFDGVAESGDHGLADPAGFGRLEYACHLLATEAGVEMARCRLHEEGGRAHFMTQRFDRVGDASTGQQALETIRRLGMGYRALEQMVLRAVVNVVIRNQDDHVKNIAFLMDKAGAWRLAPAYHVVHAHNPSGAWTSQHQMTIHGKADGFEREDLYALGRHADLKRRTVDAMLDRALDAARQWEEFASTAGVPEGLANRAQAGFRLSLQR